MLSDWSKTTMMLPGTMFGVSFVDPQPSASFDASGSNFTPPPVPFVPDEVDPELTPPPCPEEVEVDPVLVDVLPAGAPDAFDPLPPHAMNIAPPRSPTSPASGSARRSRARLDRDRIGGRGASASSLTISCVA